MVHNGIEYGMLQAYAEGYEILHASKIVPEARPRADRRSLAARQRRAVVAQRARGARLRARRTLADIKGWVADSGEGRWTVQEAIDLDVPAPVITLSLLRRASARGRPTRSAPRSSRRCATSSAATR